MRRFLEGRAHRLPCADVEDSLVARTLDGRPLEVAIGERGLLMGASIIGHVDLALDLVDGQSGTVDRDRDHVVLLDEVLFADVRPLGHDRSSCSLRVVMIRADAGQLAPLMVEPA